MTRGWRGKEGVTVEAYKKLTETQKLFVMEYCRDSNGTRAAIAAGASPRSATVQASKWLTDTQKYPHVVQAIRDEFDKMRMLCEMDSVRCIRELTKIALFNPKSLFDDEEKLRNVHDLPDEVAMCLKEFKVTHRTGVDKEGNPIPIRTVEVKVHDKLEALKQIAQHLGMLNETVNNVNNVVNVINWDALYDRQDRMRDDPIAARLERERLLLSEVKGENPLPEGTEIPGDGE